MQQPEFTTLSLTLADQIAEVRLNRPDKSNAINEAMWQELRAAFVWADTAREVRAVILSGAGRNFCAGIDLAMLAVMFGQQITAPITIKIAPDRMNVIRIVLRVVVFNQKGWGLNSIIVSLEIFGLLCSDRRVQISGL